MTPQRILTAYIFAILSLILLVIRYGYLQLFNHTILTRKAINNYSSIISTLPVRGQILDRSGIILADNITSYAVAVLPKDIKSMHSTESLLSTLSQYINLTDLDRHKFLSMRINSKNYDWVIIKNDLSNIEIANLTAHNYQFPQVAVFAYTKRHYPFDELYAHSVGYVGKISLGDKQTLSYSRTLQNYVSNDYIGKNGLEQFYESYLRGHLGTKIIQTNATGNEVGLMANISATDGYTLHLTIDHGLQQLAWNLLEDRSGAIVALDPSTGGILAFVSKPSFDPNWFIDGVSMEDWHELMFDSKKPLLNRVTQGTYPPGSTFKPFIALVALQLGVRTPSYVINDPGYFVIPGSKHRFRSEPGYQGAISMLRAITVSSDTYFYKLGLDMGIDRINASMKLLGFGEKTGIDLPQENTGLLPSKAWKAKHFANRPHLKYWQAADDIVIGIGQGFNHYTPLQMAFVTGMIATNGVMHKPHFLHTVTNAAGNTIQVYQEESFTVPIKKQYIAFIASAMQNVVNAGTARGISSNLAYTMAGKTGTAQVVGMAKNSHMAKFAGKRYKDHAWFIAFAPVEHAKIAIAIMVENGGFGASTAVPIARKLLDYYIVGDHNDKNGNSK